MQSKEHVLGGRTSIPRDRPSRRDGTGPNIKLIYVVKSARFSALSLSVDNYAVGIEWFLAVFFHSCALQFVLSDIKTPVSVRII